jgi:hypothetical protein
MPGMLVNWKVTWIITGLRPYCDDEVRKKNRFSVRGREEMKEEELYGGVPEDGEFVTKPLSG